MSSMTKAAPRAADAQRLQPDSLLLDTLQIKKLALVIRAINHPLRQQMMKIIHQTGRICVTDLYIKLRLEQSVASQHLAILRRAGFVETSRDGKQIYYSINYGKLNLVHSVARQLLEF
jgi:DNA-binding transcriptional ArsR family regulator